jgi:hypothetical protein
MLKIGLLAENVACMVRKNVVRGTWSKETAASKFSRFEL